MLQVSHPDPHIFDTDHDRFQAEVIEASHAHPILVDFWADWCGPCHALTPHLKRVIEEHDGRLLLAKLEVDEGENMRVAGRYKVRGFPTVILFQQGEERGRFSGARSRHHINEWLQEHLR
ncbi:thioredoxin family protein [Thiorhodococcus mannitoliphagus]|uniref:Thioredoxin n=1 Tax=Thiorhodococcus mannitoliphagus TaxID=329406 RepID=A0A6P1DSX8_9GAMM|nr:thioredoxin family protein [Thiorhodococcus mannitoliphagus]NEX18805.1 thioredoxin family protein [Thiorhodococcus mannitoliphagus]